MRGERERAERAVVEWDFTSLPHVLHLLLSVTNLFQHVRNQIQEVRGLGSAAVRHSTGRRCRAEVINRTRKQAAVRTYHASRRHVEQTEEIENDDEGPPKYHYHTTEW